ncbi:MAG: MFS transporter [Candidatus Bathyarchaeota archaeon]|nr:MFS transporter [Candidatus Bathyarchaeota archaeon]
MEKQARTASIILATICITYFVENFLRSAASALTPVLIQELGISRGAMGLLITGYFLIYGIMQFPSGVLADVLGPRKSIVWFTALTCIGSILFWLSYRYELLLAAQFIMGIGTSVFYINAVTLIGRWFPSDRKATAISILSASSGIGAFASYMGFPLATSILGSWRPLYFVMLILLVLNWVMNFLLLKDNPSTQPLAPVKRRNIIGSFKETLSDKRFHPLLFGYIMLAFNFTLFSWGFQFLMEAKGLTYIEAGMVTSLGTIAGFIGCLAVGVISDKLKQRKLPVLLFIGSNLVFLSIMTFIPAGYPAIVYASIWGAMSICGSIWVLFFSMVSEVLPPGKASIGLGVMNGLSTIISSLLTPLYGSFVDVTGSYFLPNIVTLGLGAFTLVVLFRYTKETYGVKIKD